MKKLITILLFAFGCCNNSRAQSYVFILVDVSKSVTASQLNDGRQALYEAFTNGQFSKAFVAYGNRQNLSNFILRQNDRLAVSKFGSLQTTMSISPSLITMHNLPGDVNQSLNAISWYPTDGQTYLTLAKAKIAEYAKAQNINNYKLIVVSDNINDDYGPGGKPKYPDGYTTDLAEGYGTSKDPVKEDVNTITKVKIASNSPFTLTFCPSVDVSNYTPPPKNPKNTTPTQINTVPEPAAIVINGSLANGRKGKEKVASGQQSINWQCANCPEGVKYMVVVSQYDGGKSKIPPQKNLTSSSAKLDLPAGKFRITVSASNSSGISSSTTYVDVKGGGGGWIFALLLLIAIAATVYYLWSKKRQQKVQGYASNKNEDMFSKSKSGSSTSSQSSQDSNYF